MESRKAQTGWRHGLQISAGVLIAYGTLIAVSVVATPDRLFVRADAVIQHPLLLSPATAALGALVVELQIAGRLRREVRYAQWAMAASAMLAVYLLSVGVVDEFQGRAGGSTSLEELGKQAQVALSVLWAVLGGAAFSIGLGRRSLELRYAGLALLGLATTKVFLFDLAALDVAYRVVSFVALGGLLLTSAYVYARLRPPGPDTRPEARPRAQ